MKRERPLRQAGVLLVAVGAALLMANTDLLGLGGREAYYRWEFLLILVGAISLLYGHFTTFVILFSLGSWLLLPDIYPLFFNEWRHLFWPAALILAGISQIIPRPGRWR